MVKNRLELRNFFCRKERDIFVTCFSCQSLEQFQSLKVDRRSGLPLETKYHTCEPKRYPSTKNE